MTKDDQIRQLWKQIEQLQKENKELSEQLLDAKIEETLNFGGKTKPVKKHKIGDKLPPFDQIVSELTEESAEDFKYDER